MQARRSLGMRSLLRSPTAHNHIQLRMLDRKNVAVLQSFFMVIFSDILFVTGKLCSHACCSSGEQRLAWSRSDPHVPSGHHCTASHKPCVPLPLCRICEHGVGAANDQLLQVHVECRASDGSSRVLADAGSLGLSGLSAGTLLVVLGKWGHSDDAHVHSGS